MSNKDMIYPSLSDRGFVNSTEGILNEIMSNYVLTDEQQSLLFRDSLISLPKTYYESINDPKSFMEKVGVELETLLKAHFEMVEVDTDVKFYPDNPSKASVVVFAEVVDKFGDKVSLGTINRVTEDGFDFRKVVYIYNYGDRFKYME